MFRGSTKFTPVPPASANPALMASSGVPPLSMTLSAVLNPAVVAGTLAVIAASLKASPSNCLTTAVSVAARNRGSALAACSGLLTIAEGKSKASPPVADISFSPNEASAEGIKAAARSRGC